MSKELEELAKYFSREEMILRRKQLELDKLALDISTSTTMSMTEASVWREKQVLEAKIFGLTKLLGES